MSAELNKPTSPRVRSRSACRKGAKVGTPWVTMETVICATIASVSRCQCARELEITRVLVRGFLTKMNLLPAEPITCVIRAA